MVSHGQGVMDSEEYEYDDSETESFLVDVDLSSLDEVSQSKVSGARRTLKAPKGARINVNPQTPDPDDTRDGPRETPVDFPESSARNVLQVLDFDSHNPIISFQDQLYSCRWTDMIGSNMFFTQHSEHAGFQPVRSADEYDLLGTSRIKLVAHRAKVAPRATSQKRKRQDDEDSQSEASEDDLPEAIPEGKSLGGLVRTNPKTNIEIKKQARFLEKLMDIKKGRGEADSVRTFVTSQTAATEARLGLSRMPALQEEIESLNRKVLKGNTDALARLQEIYSQLEDTGRDTETLHDTGHDDSPNPDFDATAEPRS